MLRQLSALGFRNLAPLSWEPREGSHLLLGDNGAGKTSVLEAVYVLATTRSFRTSRLIDCRAHGSETFHLAGEVEGDARVRLEVGWQEGKRLRRANGREAPLVEHLAALPVVAWTREDTELLSGPPELRRRFLDRGVVGTRPTSLEILSRYRRALSQKRQLLIDQTSPLEPWNDLLSQAAAQLIEQRRAYVDRLEGCFQEALDLSGLDLPAVQLRYRPSPRDGDSPETVAEALRRAEGEERRRRMPLVGPHRDDLEIRWAGQELRRTASAGERKVVAMALLAAHGKVLEDLGRGPVYLLDDADTELSATTLEAAWKCFSSSRESGPRQLFASSNRPEVWDRIPIRHRWSLGLGVLASS